MFDNVPPGERPAVSINGLREFERSLRKDYGPTQDNSEMSDPNEVQDLSDKVIFPPSAQEGYAQVITQKGNPLNYLRIGGNFNVDSERQQEIMEELIDSMHDTLNPPTDYTMSVIRLLTLEQLDNLEEVNPDREAFTITVPRPTEQGHEAQGIIISANSRNFSFGGTGDFSPQVGELVSKINPNIASFGVTNEEVEKIKKEFPEKARYLVEAGRATGLSQNMARIPVSEMDQWKEMLGISDTDIANYTKEYGEGEENQVFEDLKTLKTVLLDTGVDPEEITITQETKYKGEDILNCDPLPEEKLAGVVIQGEAMVDDIEILAGPEMQLGIMVEIGGAGWSSSSVYILEELGVSFKI